MVDPVPIGEALKQDHGVQQEIFDGLVGLFGRADKMERGEGKEIWVVDIKRIIREMGKGMLLEENVSFGQCNYIRQHPLNLILDWDVIRRKTSRTRSLIS